MTLVDLPETAPLDAEAAETAAPATAVPGAHPALVVTTLAMGGFAIGTTEFAAMSLLPAFALDLGIDAPTAGFGLPATGWVGVASALGGLAIWAASLLTERRTALAQARPSRGAPNVEA